jgi:DNA-binding NarL/FixJ family response regulator
VGEKGMSRTLIVEDNVTFRQSLKELLGTRFPSMAVEEAGDGEEALRKIDALVPDIIFMDIKLPGENGLQVTRKVKTKYPEITVIVLTYYDLPEHRDAALQCGASHFLPKGTSTEEVVGLVQSILSEKGCDSCRPNKG